MSLFKLQNLWAQTYDEEFDASHLTYGRIDGQAALALGSYSGKLRVHQVLIKSPLQVVPIYENTFESPIVSVQFVTHPEQQTRNTIGVLLFRKFIYVSLIKNKDSATYEAKLTSLAVEPAFDMCINPICLMTLNSAIQYLSPLSLEKLKVSDPIYPFFRSERELYYADGEELVACVNGVEQWRIIVGPMRQIQAIENLAIVFGDNALWEVQHAKINKTKTLDDQVSCGCVVNKGSGSFNIIVGNFQSQIMIYDQNYTLLWAVKMEEIPLKICFIKKSTLKGALCILGDKGTASISFLGSDLPDSDIEALKDEIDIDQVDSEINRYNEEILSKTGGQGAKVQQVQASSVSAAAAQITLKAKTPKFYPSHVEEDQKYLKIDGKLWSCEIECVVTPEKNPIFNVKAVISTPSNVYCLSPEHSFSSIPNRQVILFPLLCSGEKFPFSSEVKVVIRYETTDKNKGTSISAAKIALPMDFQTRLKSLQLEEKPNNKIILKCSSELPALSQLFGEYAQEIGQSKQLTVELANGVTCSMGYNKNSTKVKIESKFYSGLCYMFVLFWERFQQVKQKSGRGDLDADPPLEEFYAIIKSHFDQRGRVKQKMLGLEKKSEQFRSTQKKLLIKMKQKVSSINHIDKLLEYTYRSLMKAADDYEKSCQEMEVANHNLEVAIKFVTQMLFMKSKATQQCKDKALGILGYQRESGSFGWEEKVMSSSGSFVGKKFNYENDTCTFQQIYKVVVWALSQVNEGKWN